jgi:predicted component of type VI protein secretion system
MFDIQGLLTPVPGSDPCGPDLSYDPSFLEMEQAARGAPEMRMGRGLIAAVPPDWPRVQALAIGLLGRSKDWRTAMFLLRAALHLHGLSGLAQGLRLVNGLLERPGGDEHPRDFTDDGWVSSGGEYLLRELNALPRGDLGALGLGDEACNVLMRDIEGSGAPLAESGGRDTSALDRIDQALRAEEHRAPGLIDRIDDCVELLGRIRTWGDRAVGTWRSEETLRRALLALRDAAWRALGRGAAPASMGGATPPPARAAARRATHIPSGSLPMLDPAALSSPISAEEPCGPDLCYDASFQELEGALAGRPEQRYGDFVVPAEGPDWPRVHALAIELFGQTRDLRVAVALTRALTWAHGMAGTVAGLRLIDALLATLWPHVHPQLDPDYEDDTVVRLNALAALASPEGLLGELRMLRLMSEPGESELAQQAQQALRSIENSLSLVDPASSGQRPLGDLQAWLQSIARIPAAAPDVDAERPAASTPIEPDGDAEMPAPGDAELLDAICEWIGQSGIDAASECRRSQRLAASSFLDVVAQVAPEHAAHARAFFLPAAS